MAKCTYCGKTGIFLKTNVEGMCPDCQQKTLNDLRNSLLPEQQEIIKLQSEIQRLNNDICNINNQISTQTNILNRTKAELEEKKKQVVETDEVILLQSFGLYEPKYSFVNAEQYKRRLDEIRNKQKESIKHKTAVTGFTNWTVNGSASQGRTMVNNTQKLLLRAFNSECDEIIEKVKYSNYDASVKRINSSINAISKLGASMGIAITGYYGRLKLKELDLAFEYQQKKQQEKEEQRELKAQMREEAKLQK